MSTSDLSMTPYESVDQETAFEIEDQAQLIVARHLPDCTARRFNFGDQVYQEIHPCFGSNGPIAPLLYVDHDSSISVAGLHLHYMVMLQDQSGLSHAFPGRRFPVSARLVSGPQLIARAFLDAIDIVGLAPLIAPEKIEQTIANTPSVWGRLYRAQDAIYNAHYDDGKALLIEAIRDADDDQYSRYGDLIAEAHGYLARLESDAAALRQDFIAVMDRNWSRFQVVEAL